jgi:hypothetical protein
MTTESVSMTPADDTTKTVSLPCSPDENPMTHVELVALETGFSARS